MFLNCLKKKHVGLSNPHLQSGWLGSRFPISWLQLVFFYVVSWTIFQRTMGIFEYGNLIGDQKQQVIMYRTQLIPTFKTNKHKVD